MGLVLILVVIAIFVYGLLEYNNLSMLLESTKEKFEKFDELMKRRWEILPKTLDFARIYLDNEKNTIREINQIISNSYNSMINTKKRDVDIELTEKILKLIKLIEDNQEQFINPKLNIHIEQLKKLENEINVLRNQYNEEAKNMNKKVNKFPSNIVAKIFGFKEQVIFE